MFCKQEILEESGKSISRPFISVTMTRSFNIVWEGGREAGKEGQLLGFWRKIHNSNGIHCNLGAISVCTFSSHEPPFNPVNPYLLIKNKHPWVFVLGILLTRSAHLDSVLSLVIQSFLKPLQLLERGEQPTVVDGSCQPLGSKPSPGPALSPPLLKSALIAPCYFGQPSLTTPWLPLG